jgi:hypothetical protein
MAKPAVTPIPWWKYPMVWLVIAGPVLAVIGSFTSLALALHYPDPPLHALEDAARAPAEESQPRPGNGHVERKAAAAHHG